MAHDDWRVRVELREESHAAALLSRLGLDLGSEARALAHELASHRLAVTHDADTVFVYASSPGDAERARAIAEAELREEGIGAREIRVEHWLHDEDRWDDEPPGPTVEEELLSRGHAPWEVRVECPSRREARELAERLEAEGYDVLRHFRFVIAGAASHTEAKRLARRLHGEVEPASELVWEVLPSNPFAIFGGLGGTGTPL